MTRSFCSTTTSPHARGVEFGHVHAEQIRSNITIYQKMFEERGGIGIDVAALGVESLLATQGFAPALHTEMLGLAQGAGVDPALIGMLNARTEILALLKAGGRGECSAVIYVPHDETAPVAIQTWDWYFALRNSWLVWEIPLDNGSTTKTMTEYGIVGKAGINTRGLGMLFTILHHVNDGRRIGVPVHVAARWVMDTAPNIAGAAQLLASANVSASSSINLISRENSQWAAMTVELHPGGPSFVLPDKRGVLVHTNHFLAPCLGPFDMEPKAFPDTLLRQDFLQHQLAGMKKISQQAVLDVMASHSYDEGSVCCHHDSELESDWQYETLSTVSLDLLKCDIHVHAGGPCSYGSVNQSHSSNTHYS